MLHNRQLVLRSADPQSLPLIELSKRHENADALLTLERPPHWDWTRMWHDNVLRPDADEQLNALLQNMTQHYNHQRELTCKGALELITGFSQPASSSLERCCINHGGFLTLFHLFTGHTSLEHLSRHANPDAGASLATMLLALCHDAEKPSILTSILMSLARRPGLAPYLPALKVEAGGLISTVFRGLAAAAGYDGEEMGRQSQPAGPTPLATLLTTVQHELRTFSTSEELRTTMIARRVENLAASTSEGGWGGSWGFGGRALRRRKSNDEKAKEAQQMNMRCEQDLAVLCTWAEDLEHNKPMPAPPRPPPAQPAVVTLSPPSYPRVADFGHASRTLHAVEFTDPAVSLPEVTSLAMAPIELLHRGTVLASRASRDELGLPTVSSALGFSSQVDLTRHPDSRSKVAREMLSRMIADAEDYATDAAATTYPTLRLLEGNVATDPSSRRAGESALASLLTALEEHRDASALFIRKALPLVVARANEVPQAAAADTQRVRELVQLEQLAASRAPITSELLMTSIISTLQEGELTRLNPHSVDAPGTLNAVVALILVASRQSALNRAILDCKELLGLLRSTSSVLDVTTVRVKSTALAESLLARRHYMAAADGSFDPRLLLFEFVHCILLREPQILLIQDFVRSVERGQPLVKQMLMGGGKTTVVGPLLALLLGESDALIFQTMPSALLEQSLATLRATFSSVVRKRIFTLTVDRASCVGWDVADRMEQARQCKGVVLCSAQTLKALQLKLLEQMAKVFASKKSHDTPPSAAHEVRALTKIVELTRSSILIMDEVDMLLHPLKSELNVRLTPMPNSLRPRIRSIARCSHVPSSISRPTVPDRREGCNRLFA